MRRHTNPTRRRGVVLGRTALVLSTLLLAPVVWVQVAGQAHVVADPARAPAADVALVLGAGLAGDGTPSPYLRRRLDAAADLYARGAVLTVIASGDGVSSPGYDEPAAMREWLLERGVPDDAIVLDREGVDTTTSCRRAHEVYRVGSAVVLTQDYHLRRALFSCRAAGLAAVGVGVSAESAKPAQWVWWHVREVPASFKAAWDAVLG